MTTHGTPLTRLTNGTTPASKNVKRTKVTFREVLDMKILMQCFRLRYAQYDNPLYRHFLYPNTYGLDIDMYDSYSRHWALFTESNELCGYARIIQKAKNTRLLDAFEAIKQDYNGLFDSTLKKSPAYPIMQYQSSTSLVSLDEFFALRSEADTVELSRFIIPRASSFRLSKFMVSAGLGIYLHSFDIDTVVLACNATHEKFWKLYGFNKIGADTPYQNQNLQSVNLYSDFCHAHPTLKSDMLAYSDQYSINNEISIHL